MKSPEYLHLGDIVLCREGRTRGKGKIIKLYPYDAKKGIEKNDPKLIRKMNNTNSHMNTNVNPNQGTAIKENKRKK